MFLVMAEYSVSDVSEYAKEIGLYVVTVLVGLAIHFFIVLPLILFALAKKNPLLYYKSLLPAMATAFGSFFFFTFIVNFDLHNFDDFISCDSNLL